MMRPMAAVVALIIAALSAPVLAMPDWAAIAGDWKGHGQIREDPMAALEVGACRFAVAVSAGGSEMTFEGRCANALQSARISTNLRRDPNTGAILAASRATNIPETIQLSGRQTDAAIELQSTNTVTMRGRVYRIAVEIRFADDMRSFLMIQTVTHQSTGQQIRVLDMRFGKRS
jgi:hypothetical protein